VLQEVTVHANVKLSTFQHLDARVLSSDIHRRTGKIPDMACSDTATSLLAKLN
jgi:hypothetical protein